MCVEEGYHIDTAMNYNKDNRKRFISKAGHKADEVFIESISLKMYGIIWVCVLLAAKITHIENSCSIKFHFLNPIIGIVVL